MKLWLTTGLLLLLGSLVVAQDCPLPTDSNITSAIATLEFIGDGSQTYSPSITGPIHYVCQSQGTMKDTYRTVSIITTYTQNPGEPEETRIFQMTCSAGPTWTADNDGGLQTPAASVINGTTRTDCATCSHSFGDDRCQACTTQCPNGLGRCYIQGGLQCCSVFTASGQCSTDLTCPGVNYVANMSNGYTCTCNLTCSPGYTSNSTCTGCEWSDICLSDTPCHNGGVCTLFFAPDEYTCNCTDEYEGENCTEMVSSSVFDLSSTVTIWQSSSVRVSISFTLVSTPSVTISSFITSSSISSSLFSIRPTSTSIPQHSSTPTVSPSPTCTDDCEPVDDCSREIRCRSGYQINKDDCTCVIKPWVTPVIAVSSASFLLLVIVVVVCLFLLVAFIVKHKNNGNNKVKDEQNEMTEKGMTEKGTLL